jgi:hypothetical protein
MTINRKLTVLGLAATLALGACSESTSPDLAGATLNLDIANAVSDGAGDDVATMRELSHGLTIGMRFWLTPQEAPNPGDCPYNAGSGWHTCATISGPGGLSIDRSYAFYDAGNAAMETFDQLLTAKIHFIKHLEGSVGRSFDGGTMSADVDYARDMMVTGLAGEETSRTWNGTGASQIKRTRMSDVHGTRTYELAATVVVAGVVVPRRTADQVDAWPTAGTITKVVTGTVSNGDETRDVSRTVVITFNGTSFPDATVNGEPFVIDLAARKARRASR